MLNNRAFRAFLRMFFKKSGLIECLRYSGPIIGLEYNGDDCVRLCGETVNTLQTRDHPLYSSPSSSVAIREIENFYNFCDMQMSA